VEPGKPQGGLFAVKKGGGFFIEIGGAASEDFRDVNRHRAVEVDGNIGDLVVVGESPDVVHQLLGPFDGKRGDEQVASGPRGFHDRVAENFLDITFILVCAVTVSRLENDVISPLDALRISNQRLVPLPDVAGESNADGLAIFPG